MVALATPAARDEILSAHVTNLTNCLLGVAAYGQTIRLTQKSDGTSFANYLGNADTTLGLALQVQYGASSAPTVLAKFQKDIIYFNQGPTVLQADKTAPGATLSTIYPRTADGRWTASIGAGGTGGVLAYTTEAAGGVVSAAGDLVYATGAGAITRLPVGAAKQMLVVGTGATAPQWTNSPVGVLSGTGDLLSTTAASTLGRIAIGTAGQMLVTNAGATSPAWTASPISVLDTTGSILYASSANTLAKLAAGTNGQFLSLAAGVPVWANGSAVRNVAASSVGATSGPTTTSGSYATIPDMSTSITTSGGDLICHFTGTFLLSTPAALTIGFSLDGAAEVCERYFVADVVNDQQTLSLVHRFAAPSSTAHTVTVRWKVGAGTASAVTTNRETVCWET